MEQTMQLLFSHHVVHPSFTSSGCSQTSKKIKKNTFLKTGVSNPNGRLRRFGAKGTLRATPGQVRSSSLFSNPLITLSFYLPQSHRLCLARVHASRLGLERGIVNYPIAARAYFREKEGFGCHRFSGSELRAGTLHLPVLRKRRRWRRRMQREGWVYMPGSSTVEKARQLSNRAFALLSALC